MHLTRTSSAGGAPVEPLVRVSVEELESRAKVRLPGYVEAFKAAARSDPVSAGHLLIPAATLRELWQQYTAPGLGDELLTAGNGCCGG